MQQKTIWISLYDGDTEKNILRSGIFPLLKASGARIVLLVRSAKRVPYYEQEFKAENVEVELLPNATGWFEILYNHISWNTIPTYSVYLRRHDMYLVHKNILRYAGESVLGFLGRFKLWRNILRGFYYVLPDNYADELFRKYKPDVIFTPNMFSPDDCRLLKAAKKRRIPSITTVKSWDVLTTKAFTRVRADMVLVFNEYNAREAVVYGDYKPSQVVITGFPQFDIYAQQGVLESREAFCKKTGLDPQAAIILFAVPGDWKMQYTDEVLKHIDSAIERGEIYGPVQILARVHPKYPSKVEQRKDYKHVVIERPGTYFSAGQERSLDTSATGALAWTFTDKDIIHLANSLYHSAVTVNIESTMTLDAAAFNKPIVLVGYDGDQQLPYLKSIVRNYDRNHYRYVIETGGARLAKNPKELIQDIQAYLKNPALDREKRELLREKLLYKVDGKSSQRAVDAVLNLLNKNK